MQDVGKCGQLAGRERLLAERLPNPFSDPHLLVVDLGVAEVVI